SGTTTSLPSTRPREASRPRTGYPGLVESAPLRGISKARPDSAGCSISSGNRGDRAGKLPAGRCARQANRYPDLSSIDLSPLLTQDEKIANPAAMVNQVRMQRQTSVY